MIAIERSKYERALSLKDEEFKLLIGVTKETAREMIEELREAYQAKQ